MSNAETPTVRVDAFDAGRNTSVHFGTPTPYVSIMPVMVVGALAFLAVVTVAVVVLA